MREWRIGRAKQSFSEVVKLAENEPQKIFNRDRLVAAVIGRDLYEELELFLENRSERTLAEVAAEIRDICEAEGYTLDVGERVDRKSWISDER